MSSWAAKQKLRIKMLKPSGVNLTPKESEQLAEDKREDLRLIDSNMSELREARNKISVQEIKGNIEQVEESLRRAKGVYKQCKNPIKKREWARRVVVANNTRETLKESLNRLENAKQRFEMLGQDMEMEKMQAKVRIQEAEVYAKAGKYLTLKGEELVNARSNAKKMQIEYDNLEVSMEGAEKLLSIKDVTGEADQIAGVKEDER